MLKNILAVVLGLATSFAIILVFEIVQHIIYPPPANLDMNDMEAVKAFSSTAPPVIFTLVIIAYALGSLLGGLVAAARAANNRMTKSIMVGGILMGFGAYNRFMMPHPVWTILISLFLFIPCSYLGGYIGIRMSAKKRRAKETGNETV